MLKSLASAEDGTEDNVVRAVERVGCLAEIFDAIDATQLVKYQAERVLLDAKQFSRTTGHCVRHS